MINNKNSSDFGGVAASSVTQLLHQISAKIVQDVAEIRAHFEPMADFTQHNAVTYSQ